MWSWVNLLWAWLLWMAIGCSASWGAIGYGWVFGFFVLSMISCKPSFYHFAIYCFVNCIALISCFSYFFVVSECLSIFILSCYVLKSNCGMKSLLTVILLNFENHRHMLVWQLVYVEKDPFWQNEITGLGRISLCSLIVWKSQFEFIKRVFGYDG